MILQRMLQRLFASLMRGPGLNAKPHNSRQRIDVMEFRHFGGDSAPGLIAALLAGKSVDIPATVPVFKKPEYPESEWSDEQKAEKTASDRQNKLLTKLREIAEDSSDYYNDHGEHALFLGFPLVSIPNGTDRFSGNTNRILAPVMLAAINVRVRRTTRPGVTIELAAEGADLLTPNPALLAWIEQQTGKPQDELFSDDAGEAPWQEIAEALAFVANAAGTPEHAFTETTLLSPIPKSEGLPEGAAILNGAVLGLLPLANPGLLRDTRWMQENEAALGAPVSAFLKPEALAPASDEALPEAMDYSDTDAPAAPVVRNYAAEWLVTQADPCQADAVAHARSGQALVIHGPPGTGKSQTIANIIGDHLARGERVLFVCDKRTALDVVKYRLDSMGLGEFCGVIHDPQRDRRDFYLGLRDRLQNLAQATPVPNRQRELALVNQRLSDLHQELRANFDQLHFKDEHATASFHDLCGSWMEASAAAETVLNCPEGLTLEQVILHRTDVDEVLRRSLAAGWPGNPFKGRIGIALTEFVSRDPNEFEAFLKTMATLAAEADTQVQDRPISLSADLPFPEQAIARDRLAHALEAAGQLPDPELVRMIATSPNLAALIQSHAALSAHAAALDQPLDSELAMALKGALPGLPAINRANQALEIWKEKSKSWTRVFAFGPKKAALEVLAPLGLPLTDESLERVAGFFAALKSRWMWTDFTEQITKLTAQQPFPDERLRQIRDGMPVILEALEASKPTANAPALAEVTAWMNSPASRCTLLINSLRASARRAERLERLLTTARESTLFKPQALRDWTGEWASGTPASPPCTAMVGAVGTLEEVVRREERADTLPAALKETTEQAALAGLNWEKAEPVIRTGALALALRERIKHSPELARLDTNRIEAAFAELQERAAEKQALVREQIIHFWRDRWSKRLLASTGSRLNPEGAALRQRLLVRGQRAMKLRQMIAAGSETEGGDPLFDLCPVWMASPTTVSQIFPKQALFDVIIFDEASQCRLEEALPVLLRGKRVVIAGDPKQLPPTRFFEQALAESDDTAAETAEEVFDQQQSEAEDLLTAALNLDVQEAFLDVHYRSRNEALIGFSNEAFYGSRLQPIPGHPRNRAVETPIRLVRVDGVYQDRTNVAEAKRAVEIVAALLEETEPPSIGIACFNLTQRDAILDALDEKATADRVFAERLEIARKRRGRDSFEGLFVKNLENVQGDERDHLIICTTFGPDPQNKFRRNFGALSRLGGERRLNVLVTRARSAIHVLTSIPRTEYLVPEPLAEGLRPNGRHFLYDYLRYAERLAAYFEKWQDDLESAKRDADPVLYTGETDNPSAVAETLGQTLHEDHRIGSTVYWGNDGFRVDVALTHPEFPEDVTVGVISDFTRYRKTPDPIVWEQFRANILRAQGWELHRVWTPGLFRKPEENLREIIDHHTRIAAETTRQVQERLGKIDKA